MIPPTAALACLLAAALGTQGSDVRTDRLASAELDLRGPASALVVEVPGAGRALFVGSFPAGASVHAEVALPTSGRSLEGAPTARFEGTGSAQLALLPGPDRARRGRFDALPRGLRARAPVTPPEAGPPPPSRAALLLVAGLFALGWQLRRRGAAALGLGAVGAAAVFALARAPAAERTFVVVEAQGPGAAAGGRGPAFVLVEAARERLFVGGTDDVLRVESRPTRAELVFRATPGAADLVLEGAGATLFAFRDGAALSLGRATNGVFDLERVWIREAGEAGWVALGPWARGAPLPAPGGEPASDPPGWLVGALPQGPGVLVGGGGDRWLRWIDVGEKPAAEH